MLDIRKSVPACAKTLEHVSRAHEALIVCDQAGWIELCEKSLQQGLVQSSEKNRAWYGGLNFQESMRLCRDGDLSTVASSQALMEQISALTPSSPRKRFINDVVGALPNIPQYLSGNPLNMRRMSRQQDAYGPLSIFVDITASGAISAKTMQQRGIAILALVQHLCSIRPTELYVMCSLGDPFYKNGPFRTTAAIRLDTSPLDLARAAFMLTHASVSRSLAFNNLWIHTCERNWMTKWGLGVYGKHIATISDQLRSILHIQHDLFYIGSMFATEDFSNSGNAVTWLENKLREIENLAQAA